MDNLELTWIALAETWNGPLEVSVQGNSMEPTLIAGDRVTIEPATVAELRHGDIVLMRDGARGVLHRYCGRDAAGHLLTRGDNRRYDDTPWPPTALVGRATRWQRAGRLYHADAPAQRRAARYHLFLGQLWRHLRRMRALLPILLALLLTGSVLAAVTITQFTATYQNGRVHLYWETASEVDLIGFYVQRAVDTPVNYTRITEDIIPAEGSIVGAPYSFDDTAIQPGRTYYYLLEAEDTMGNVEAHGPVTITIPGPTLTPTPGPSPTPTRTPTPGPSPTPTRTPIPLASPTPVATATPRPAATATPRPAATATRTSTPVPGVTPAATSVVVASVTPAPTVTPVPATDVPTPAQPTTTVDAGSPTSGPTPTRIPITPMPTPNSTGSSLIVAVLVLLLLLGGAFWWWRRRL